MQRRIARYGVEFASKKLEIPLVEVDFVSSELLGQTTITAMFLPDQNRILFNSDWLKEAKPEEILLTTFHEARHAYQKCQIEALKVERNTEPAAVLKRWEVEFEAYHRAPDSRTDDPGCLGQEIEKDARDFAGKMFQSLFQNDFR